MNRASTSHRLPVILLAAACMSVACGEEPVDVPGPPTSLVLAPDSAIVNDGETRAFEATLLDASERVVPDGEVGWSIRDPEIATVDETGVVTGVRAGVTRLAARSGRLSDTATVLVRGPVAVVRIQPDSSLVVEGGTRPLVVTVLDGFGSELTEEPVIWNSRDPGIALVDDAGRVTGLLEGDAIVTATAEGVVDSASIVVFPALAFDGLAPANTHTCGHVSDDEIFCWGSNATGQLGQPDEFVRPIPGRVVGGSIYRAVTTGLFHSCGRSDDGRALCWGDNSSGQLGDGTTRIHSRPVAVTGGLVFDVVSAGEAHTCGIDQAGATHCWGDNSQGQLGIRTTSGMETAPAPISSDPGFVVIASGGRHTCGLTGAGAAYCWGDNDSGQLGDGTTQDRGSPVPVAGGHIFATLSAGARHSCAITSAGEGFCWGRNDSGQLGDGTLQTAPEPTPVIGGLTFTALSAGGAHTCGVAADGSAYCWGSDALGQLGLGSVTGTDHTEPVAVSGGIRMANVASGAAHTCAISVAGIAYCWGSGGTGQLGIGTETGRPFPVRVFGQVDP